MGDAGAMPAYAGTSAQAGAPSVPVLPTGDAERAGLEARIAALEAEIERDREREAKLRAVQDQRQAFILEQNAEIARLRERLGEAESRPRARGGDDLQEIPGVGSVYAKRLRSMGVTTFRQVALWSDDDIERIGPQLGPFPDRIRRENWRESARQLHIEYHGEEPDATPSEP
jgi:predicted flap endonuclease-1-like 5' DNA nuclease